VSGPRGAPYSAEPFRRQGFAATGLKQIVAEAQAPFGSVYPSSPYALATCVHAEHRGYEDVELATFDRAVLSANAALHPRP